jgi:hypothetical protein
MLPNASNLCQFSPTTENKTLDEWHALHHRKQLQRLYSELIPTLLGVSTLVVVTMWSFQQAVEVLLLDEDPSPSNTPDVFIMLVFSAIQYGIGCRQCHLF